MAFALFYIDARDCAHRQTAGIARDPEPSGRTTMHRAAFVLFAFAFFAILAGLAMLLKHAPDWL